MKARHTTTILILLFILGLSACQVPTPTTSPLSPLESTSPLLTPTLLAYPAISEIAGPNFILDRPVLPGAFEVTGRGPFNVQIIIVDMTLMGRQIGSGKIGPDGMFSIQLDDPAIANHVIGIQIGTDSQYTTPEFAQALLEKRGEGFKNYPNVGLAYDTVLVGKPK